MSGGMVTAPQSHAARLFKTLVVAGASLGVGACGGESQRTVDSNDSGSSGGSDAAGSGGHAGAGGHAGSSAQSGMGGTSAGSGSAGVGGSIEACGSAAQLACSCPRYFDCSPSSVPPGADITCTCDPSRPAAPTDCAHTEQFTCISYTPSFESCHCDPDAPVDETDCPQPLWFSCHGRDPAVGCYCAVPIK